MTAVSGGAGRPRLQEIVIDCADPVRLGEFWATIMQTRLGIVDANFAVVDAGPCLIAFQQVPEPKSSPKNRLHIDVEVDDLDGAVSQAVALGARVIHDYQGTVASGCIVLADPEDNEFCFVWDPVGQWREMADAALARSALPER